jgi:hypothetical protein
MTKTTKVKEMENPYQHFLKEIKGNDRKKWKPQKQGIAVEIIETFVSSNMEMAEIDLNALPEPEPRKGAKDRSSKQDTFASSFYAWKKKSITQEKLNKMKIDVLLIRRGDKVALKKVQRKE